MGIINEFRTFDAVHCETAATKSLLLHNHFQISEPMMLGLSQGFGFIYWKMNFMNLPFIGGRAKPFELSRVFSENLNIEIEERQTASKKKAWLNVEQFIDLGIPVGLQVDCYHLEHFQHGFHFAGHFISVYGYDSNYAYIFDTGKKYKVSLENLEKARFEKGVMAAKARSYSIRKVKDTTSIESVIPKAVQAIATDFLNPPLKCFGYYGILKLGSEMLKWLGSTPNPRRDLNDQADLMENGGTGGRAIFRNLFRDFLYESLEFLPGNSQIKSAADLYKQAALNWSKIASLIKKAGDRCEQSFIREASDLCKITAEIEKEAMESLLRVQ